LRREEMLLRKLQETALLMSHKETKAFLREAIKNKGGDIKTYKAIIKASEKCPAVKKTTTKKTSTCKKSARESKCR
jgi:hypothetical protein